MKILICSRMSDATLERVLCDRVIYRPDLCRRPAPLARSIVARLRPDALLLHARDSEHIASLAAERDEVAIIVYGDRVASAPAPDRSRRVHIVHEDTVEDAEQEAVAAAERLAAGAPGARGRRAPADAVLVGAGVVNLVTALELVDAGWTVAVHDRMADPLAARGGARGPVGATFGGQDARIFSFNEARHHLARDHAPGAPLPFRHSIGQGGWLSLPAESLGRGDRAWIEGLEATPPWLAREYNADIIRFNRRSFAGWHRLFAAHPHVLRGTGFVSRLLRIYQTPAGYERARAGEAEIGALDAALELSELVALEPALAPAAASGAIAGALRVKGFSLQVQTLARNLVRHLAERGVRFHWSSEVDGLGRDPAGRVAGLTLGGRAVEADSYVLSPGAFGGPLRASAAALQPIGAMAGAWVVLPNDEPRLTSPLKVGRRGFASAAAAEGANVIPGVDRTGRPVLFCSAGHGFVGVDPASVAVADLAELARSIEETAAELFPDKAARSSGEPRPVSHCVRPWTPSGLGVFHAEETASGGVCVVTGGHNTGGFAQSPEVAAAVARALEGAAHDMHDRYRSGRHAAFAAGGSR